MDILVSSILLCLSTVVKYLGYLSILVTYSLSSHILSKVNRDVIKYLHFFFSGSGGTAQYLARRKFMLEPELP